MRLADLPDKVKSYFITKDFLSEGQARELLNLLHCNNLSPWLSREGVDTGTDREPSANLQKVQSLPILPKSAFWAKASIFRVYKNIA